MHGSPRVPSPNDLFCVIRHLFVEIIKINLLCRQYHKAEVKNSFPRREFSYRIYDVFVVL
jgi:hypothetical protein